MDSQAGPAADTGIPDWTIDQLSSLARHWISECRNSHAKCISRVGQPCTKRTIPRRLIDVSRVDAKELKLIDRQLGDSPLMIGPETEYIALSYVWGAPLDHRTLSKNIAGRLQGFDITELPQTLQDAVILTEKLGFRYIWIDALCIIQDSDTDWQEQARIMGDIYSNAVCTLAGSTSSSSDDGMLGKSVTCQFGDYEVSVPLLPPSSKRTLLKDFLQGRPKYRSDMPMGMQHNQINMSYWCVEPPLFEQVSQAPLESRAWTFQERILSPRRLCLHQLGLFWECSAMSASQHSPSGLNSENDEHGRSNRLTLWTRNDSTDYFHRASWHDIVGAYTGRSLTRSSDRLPAIGGVAADLRAAGVKPADDEYMAGLWRSSFAFDLCWTSRRLASSPPIPPNFLTTPTWSWASQGYNWPVSYNPPEASEGEHESSVVHTRVIDVQLDLADNANPFSQARFGRVTLEGPLCKIENPATIGIGNGPCNAADRLFDPSSRPYIYSERTGPNLSLSIFYLVHLFSDSGGFENWAILEQRERMIDCYYLGFWWSRPGERRPQTSIGQLSMV